MSTPFRCYRPLFRAVTASLAGITGLIGAASTVWGQSGGFLSRPDIHGDNIVFTSEGDLWLGSLKDNTASRLTAAPGVETTAHFSPDGNQIAFTAQYDGSGDIYILSTNGGTPTRLTFLSGRVVVLGWSPDGKEVLYRAGDTPNDPFKKHLWSVSAKGGTPHAMPLPTVEHAAMRRDGKRIAYVPISAEWQHWYRYEGGMADDVYTADASGKNVVRLTDNKGIDTTPVWLGDNVYFVSERSGVGNLYRVHTETRATVAVSKFTEQEVRYPATDGKRIIMEYGNGLALFDPATGTTKPLPLSLRSDRIHTLPHPLAVNAQAAELSLGPTGKRVLAAWRGQIVSVPVESGDTRVLVDKPGSRAQHPEWSPDGKWFAYVSDASGEEQVWIAPASPGDTTAPRQVTRDHKGPLSKITWSPDGKYLLTSDEDMQIFLVNAATGATETIYRGKFSGSYNTTLSDYVFSPDGKWVAFTGIEPGWIAQTFLYEIATKKTTLLSPPDVNTSQPVFDPTGKYLVYLSDRNINPTGDSITHFFRTEKTTMVSLVTLAKTTLSPFVNETDEEGMADKPARGSTDAAPKKPDAPDTKPKLPTMVVDTDGIADRVVDVPLPAGNYGGMMISQDNRLLIGESGKLLSFELKSKSKPNTVAEGITDAQLSADGKKLMVRRGTNIVVVPVSAAALPPDASPVNVAQAQISVDPVSEWKQIFEESWRLARDQFYDPNMHGIDWKAVHDKYAKQLPAVYDRSDLQRILGNMIAELNTGHAYVGGGDFDLSTGRRPVPQGYLGVDGEVVKGTDGTAGTAAYRIDRLIAGDGFDNSVRSPLLMPGLQVKKGDYLIAVNGQPVQADQPLAALLVGTAGKQIAVTVNDKPSLVGARTMPVVALNASQHYEARYYAWVQSRREYIKAHANGANIAYVHIPDMSGEGLREFAKHYYSAAQKADAVIYDVRENGGGYISAMLLLQMSARPLSYFKPRNGESWTRQDFGFPGYSVALCNENSGSNAEEFCDAFQRMKLGPVIGTRSWGGEVGSGGGYSLLDGGTLNIPNYGAWEPGGKWIIEGTGVIPDIEVAQEPNAVMAGRDPQLDKAIAVLLEKLNKEPIRRPVPPPFPNKAFKPATKTASNP